MTPEPDLVAAADRNFIGSYQKLVQHQAAGSVRWFGPVFAFVSKLEVSIFNGVIVAQPATPGELREAVDWLDQQLVPYSVWIREAFAEELAPPLVADGFERLEWIEPVMSMQLPVKSIPPAGGVTVMPVQDEAALEEHIGLMVASGLPEATVRLMYAPSFATDPDVRIFTASVDGRPVGNSIAIRTGDVSGVYAVGTRPEARRKGVGTAATWAAIGAGQDWGCSMVVLQSSEMGFGVYSAMGFTELTRYVMFRRPAPVRK